MLSFIRVHEVWTGLVPEGCAPRPSWQAGGWHSPTHLARALKEWLKDLAARWSRVWGNTSIFRGLKLSPSSGDGYGERHMDVLLAKVVAENR